MSRDPESPGARIRQLREKKGLTQQELAESAEVSVGFLSELEHDKRNPSGRVLLRLARTLGSTTDYILEGGQVATATTGGPQPIPPELAEAAERAGLSYQATAILAELYQPIARRGGTGRPPTAAEWLEIYRAMKPHIDKLSR